MQQLSRLQCHQGETVEQFNDQGIRILRMCPNHHTGSRGHMLSCVCASAFQTQIVSTDTGTKSCSQLPSQSLVPAYVQQPYTLRILCETRELGKERCSLDSIT